MCVREKNPDAYIICLYGMMGKDTTIDSGIRTALNEMSDPKIVYNPFAFEADQNAANGHPCLLAQSVRAESLGNYIESLI